MTDLQTRRPPKGDWKKKISICSRRGNHNYRVKGKYLACKDCDYKTERVITK